MIFEEKNYIKKRKKAIFKTPEIENAEELLKCVKTIFSETTFLGRSTEDWKAVTVESEEKWVRSVRESKNTLVIACYIDDKIAGDCGITFKTGNKSFHRANVGIMIRKKYWNIGIGTAMFEELIKTAKEHNVTEIIDLEFIEGNNHAKALYEKFGFEVVSVKPNYYKLKNGTYQNLVYMQKYL